MMRRAVLYLLPFFAGTALLVACGGGAPGQSVVAPRVPAGPSMQPSSGGVPTPFTTPTPVPTITPIPAPSPTTPGPNSPAPTATATI